MRALSSLLVALGWLALALLNARLRLLPGGLALAAGAALAGLAHAWPAFGTRAQIEARARELAAEAIGREL